MRRPARVGGRAVRPAGGRRADLGGRYFRSKMEANVARWLRFLKEAGVIAEWEYEPEEFEFPVKRGTRFYRPDFRLTYPDGRCEFWEVKGWLDRKSAVQLKRMAKHHPDVMVKLVDRAEYGQISRVARGLVAGWE